jgi:hypothetical protein
LTAPLNNENRGGFYISDFRLRSDWNLGHGLTLHAQGNLMTLDFQEAYLEGQKGTWTLRLGKFRGAGLKSMVGFDEYDQPTVTPQYYAGLWAGINRIFGRRDFGLQIEKSHADGQFQHRFFAHNASWQNPAPYTPNYALGAPAQVVGFHYAWDWTVGRGHGLGGHLGGRANQAWDEFIGEHEFWEAAYWFKTNAVVDGSMYHLYEGNGIKLMTEAMLLSNRNARNPVDSTFEITWGGSFLVSKRLNSWWEPYGRYELTDPTDGRNNNDALHLFTMGTLLRMGSNFPNWLWKMEAVRIQEEGFVNSYGNDLISLQLQGTF